MGKNYKKLERIVLNGKHKKTQTELVFGKLYDIITVLNDYYIQTVRKFQTAY